MIGLQDLGVRLRASPNSTSWNEITSGDGLGVGFSQSKPVMAIASMQYSIFHCWNLSKNPRYKN